jgi:hypothetical protein
LVQSRRPLRFRIDARREIGYVAHASRSIPGSKRVTTMADRKTCFVIMGFGKKTDYQTGRVLNLDSSYHSMIKPAVEDAGLECIRADEIVHAGVIDVPMYKQIFTADVVIADLSTANCNAFYELGVRHAMRPYTTIIIAEDQFVYPFDVNHDAIRKYKHLGDDVGYSEAIRFRGLLKDAIQTITARPEDDSPVYTYLKGLRPPGFAEKAQTAAEATAAGAGVPPTDAKDLDARPVSVLLQQARDAHGRNDFASAKALLKAAREIMKPKSASDPRLEDPYIIQQLALVTYKSEQPTVQQALEEARDVLAELAPTTSNDTETLGLWGAVHKRLWEVARRPEHLDDAVRAYERGFYLRNDYYNGINFAYLLNVRAANASTPADAVTDFVQAERVRQEVRAICEALLEKDAASSPSDKLSSEARYWVEATKAEALLGLGDAGAESMLADVLERAPRDWMAASTRVQADKLRKLVASSPRRFLSTGV